MNATEKTTVVVCGPIQKRPKSHDYATLAKWKDDTAWLVQEWHRSEEDAARWQEKYMQLAGDVRTAHIGNIVLA